MKKTSIIFLLIMTIILSGCSVLKLGDKKSEIETLQEMGLAYKKGEYVIKNAFVSGYITNKRTTIRLGIPVGKRLIEGQDITVTAVTGAYLKTAAGKPVLGDNADLTPYVEGASIRNDGAILFISLKNSNKWTGSDGKAITDDTPIAGIVNIEFMIS